MGCYPIRRVRSGIGGGQHFVYIQKRFMSATINQKFKNVFCFFPPRILYFFFRGQLVDWWRRNARGSGMNQQEIRPSISRRANRKDKLSLRRRGCFDCRLSVGSNLTTSNKKTACVCEEWENIAERCQSNRTHTQRESRESIGTRNIALVGRKGAKDVIHHPLISSWTGSISVQETTQ